MYIKKLILDGFKSYGKRTEVDGFDKEFTAITGLNGTGKSNILDSICFVLGISNLSQVKTIQTIVNFSCVRMEFKHFVYRFRFVQHRNKNWFTKMVKRALQRHQSQSCLTTPTRKIAQWATRCARKSQCHGKCASVSLAKINIILTVKRWCRRK